MADTQIVEIIGRNWLVSELYRSGVEVARPERDHGIDLIAFVDLDKSGKFVGRPIQMKASTSEAFGVWRKLEKFPDLLIAYVWHVTQPSKTVCYCLTSVEANSVAHQMSYTKTEAWTKDGIYVTTRPGETLRELLDAFKMTPEKWRLKVGAGIRGV
jgi:hypothetical protein